MPPYGDREEPREAWLWGFVGSESAGNAYAVVQALKGTYLYTVALNRVKVDV
jgi:hypothetical protein